MKKYLFEKPLEEGIIKKRPNRFIMFVDINGKIEKCHCPSTGKISDLKFEDIPCLVSFSDNPERKTKYTVEAFSLDPLEKKEKSWIGINQTKANAYIEFFLKTNQLDRIIKNVETIKREVSLGKSRIDFLINNKDYLEVKTPLKDIPCNNHPKCIPDKKYKFLSFDRLIKHFQDISKDITQGNRAILLMCYIFNAKRFEVPPSNEREKKIVNAAKKANKKGLENWQINLKIDKEGVGLINYFQLNLF